MCRAILEIECPLSFEGRFSILSVLSRLQGDAERREGVHLAQGVSLGTTYSRLLQGYLAHTKHPPPRILRQDFTYGPMVILGGGLFLMSEAPL